MPPISLSLPSQEKREKIPSGDGEKVKRRKRGQRKFTKIFLDITHQNKDITMKFPPFKENAS